MTRPPPPRNSAAFSLIEVLVALALMTLVLTLSALLLRASGRVTEAIHTPPPRQASHFVRLLESDLDRLVRGPLPRDEAGLILHPEEGLSFPVLLTDASNRPRRFRVRYLWNVGSEIRRVLHEPLENVAVTNTVLSARTYFRIVARNDGKESVSWPPESNSPPPAALRVELEVAGEAPISRDLFLPASLHVTSAPAETP